MTIGTRIYTWWNGERVGEDHLGNVYYRGKRKSDGAREKRWVVYKEIAEASLVPPEWHAWLHHTIAEVPGPDAGRPKKPWQKEHQPNLTGTAHAYRPPGHVLAGDHRHHATGDYEAWTPN